MGLTLMARILTLVLALVVVLILKALIAMLTLIVFISALVAVPGKLPSGDPSFHSWGSDDSLPKRVLHGWGTLPWHQSVSSFDWLVWVSS